MRCVAYCRVSTDHEEQRTSIEAQKKHYADLFNTEGYQPAKIGMLYGKKGTRIKRNDGIFADEGISGTSLLRREAFNAMLEHAKNGEFDVIYIKSVSRFSRNVEDGIRIWKDLREAKVRVVFEDNPTLNNLDVDSDIIFTIYISLAQQESVTKSTNVKWGLKKLYEGGGYNGGAPYGYTVENARLVRNEDEAEVVEEIYNLFLNDGYGLGKLARYLNNKGITTKTGKKWSQTQVNRILGNEIYKGIQRSHTTETVDITRKTKNKIDEDKHIVNENEGLKIVDEDTFINVQRERAKRSEMFTKNTHHSSTNLLSTLVYCSHCGGAYKRKKRHSYSSDGVIKDIGYEWTCGINDMYGKGKCGHRNSFTEEELILKIKNEIIRLKTEDMGYYFWLYLKVKFNYAEDMRSKEVIQSERDAIKRELKSLFKQYDMGILNEKHYYEQVKELNSQLTELDAEQTRNERVDLDGELAELKFEEYKKYIQEVDVDNLSNPILKKIFSVIKIGDSQTRLSTKKRQHITFNYQFMDMSLDELNFKAERLGLIDLTGPQEA